VARIYSGGHHELIQGGYDPCSETGIVQFEYGGYAPANDGDATHVRQITCPVLFTVRPTLRITGVSLSRLIESPVQRALVESPEATSIVSIDVKSPLVSPRPSLKRDPSSFHRDHQAEAQLVQALEAAATAGDHCLLQVDLLNSFSSPLEACLERLSDDESEQKRNPISPLTLRLKSYRADAHLLARRLVNPGATER
jgi:hypothetical protein